MSQKATIIVGQTIRRIRQERGFTQEGFAFKAHLDRSFYGRVERGSQNIALNTLCTIARALGVPPGDLLADLDDEERP